MGHKKTFFHTIACACVFLGLIGGLILPATLFASIAQVEILHSRDRYPAGGAYPVGFRIRIADAHFIHGPQSESEGLIPTALAFAETQGIKIQDIRFPHPQKQAFAYAREKVAVFSGNVGVKATLVIPEETPMGGRTIEGRLSYQACSLKACFPPEEVSVRVSFLVAPKGQPTESRNPAFFASGETTDEAHGKRPDRPLNGGLWFTLMGIFLGGLALNLTPCIYPLIPITLSYFGGQGRRLGGGRLLHGLLYILGLSLTNASLGLTASLSGGMLGATLQNPLVLCFVAGILLLLALSFFGLWELRLPAGLTRMASKNYGGYFGTFFMGLTLGIVAAPCLGPFILGLVAFVGQQGDPYLGFLYFFVLSLGMGLPLSLLAVFSKALDRMPLSGPWMLWIRKGLGWVLVGMAAYLIHPVMSPFVGKPVLLAVVLTAAGLHLGWPEKGGRPWRAFVVVRYGMGLFLMVAALVLLWRGFRSEPGVTWQAYEPALMERAAQEDKPVLLDFYAAWCGPCVAMEKEVFHDPEVVNLSRRFVTLRVDLTKKHPLQAVLERRYGIKGVPTLLFFNRFGMEEKVLRIESYVGRDEMLRRMGALVPSPGTG